MTTYSFCCLSLCLFIWIQYIAGEACEVGVCPSPKHHLDSQAYFLEGNLQFEDGAIKDSLAFYRAAVRICPLCGLYLMQLAEAELQLGLKAEAKRRLLQAQGKPASDDDRIKDLLETQLQDVDATADIWIQRSFPTLRQQSNIEESNVQVFGSHPWVMRNAFQVDSIRDLVGYDTIRSLYGNVEVDYYPQNMKIKPNRVFHATLEKAMDFLEYPLGAYMSHDISEPGTYIQWNINSTLFHDLLVVSDKLGYPVRHVSRQLMAFFDFLLTHSDLPDIDTYYRQPHILSNMIQTFSKKTHWYMLLIGEEGSGMFMHTDNLPVSSWQMQLEGSKRWILCQPVHEDSADVRKNCNLHMNQHCMLEDSCEEVILQPGDLLYYPANYWHYTSCLSTPTMSLSGTILHQHHPEALIHMIQQECKDHKLGYQFDVILCTLVQHVQLNTENALTAHIDL